MASIRDLVNLTTPTPSEKEKAINAKNVLVEKLKKRDENQLLPSPIEIFLVGSYIRNTKIHPLDDIDLFYVMCPEERRQDGGDYVVNCNFDFSDCKDEDNNISSIKILERLKKEMMSEYPQSEIKRNKEVVRVYLRSYDINFDIAPVFYVTNKGYYNMPLGDGSKFWKRTNPKRDVNILNDLNGRHNSFLKGSIRVAKYWFKLKQIKNPRSYHLESICYNIFAHIPPVGSYKECMLALYRGLNRTNLQSCPDPTELSDDLTSKLVPDEINRILNEADTAIKHLNLSEASFTQYVDPSL